MSMNASRLIRGWLCGARRGGVDRRGVWGRFVGSILEQRTRDLDGYLVEFERVRFGCSGVWGVRDPAGPDRWRPRRGQQRWPQ